MMMVEDRAAALTGDELLAQVQSIRQWQAGDQRAPHKPLLLLFMLGRLQRHGERLLTFDQVADPLSRLLEQFGPPRRRQRPEYPFWRLGFDGELWEVEGAELVELTRSGDPQLGSLRRGEVRGGLSPQVASLLRDDDVLFARVVATLLDNNFQSSLHEDLCLAAGILLNASVVIRADRDPEFRIEVLRAYEYRCAMCGYDGCLDTVPGRARRSTRAVVGVRRAGRPRQRRRPVPSAPPRSRPWRHGRVTRPSHPGVSAVHRQRARTRVGHRPRWSATAGSPARPAPSRGGVSVLAHDACLQRRGSYGQRAGPCSRRRGTVRPVVARALSQPQEGGCPLSSSLEPVLEAFPPGGLTTCGEHAARLRADCR